MASSSCVAVSSDQKPHVAHPPSYELVPLYVLLPSYHQPLAQDQVTSLVGEPLERPGKLAAPEVQPLMLAAQPEKS